jgi:transcriptional regulator with XRE-family HTH domain
MGDNELLSRKTTSGKLLIMSMQEISKKLGENLKKVRAKKKLSQGDIARALEVDKGYISNIESGNKNPTLATTQRLVDALGVSADELIK